MTQSTLALIILAITCILFILDKLPLSVVAMCSSLAMAFTGIITFSDAMSGFSQTITLMILGMGMLSAAIFSTGLSAKISHVLRRVSEKGERTFMIVIFLLSMVLCTVINGMIIVTIFAPIIDSVAQESGGKIRRRMCYLPMSIGSILGNNITAISASSIMMASSLLEQENGTAFSFFAPLMISWPGILFAVIFFLTFGYKMQDRVYTFEETKPDIHMPESGGEGRLTVPQWLTILITAACVVGFVVGLDKAGVALLGAMVAILLKLCTTKQGYNAVSWETVFTVAGSFGFAMGITKSGAAEVITQAIIKACGPLASSPFVMCVIVMLISCLISEFTSNTASVAMLMPIAMGICHSLGADPFPFALATGCGSCYVLATPICTATLTFSVSVGYRVKDIAKVGGLINLALLIGAAILLKLLFFM